jgi:tyrosinase
MLWLYETALQDECGYKGALPYWDWSLDTPENGGAQFNASPVFDPVTGFGGNGLGGSVPEIGSRPAGFVGIPSGGCVVDGPFADLKVILDPGPLPANGIIKASSGRCLRRNFQLDAANAALSWNANVVPLLNLTTFPEFTAGFDENVGKIGKYGNGVHSGGHFGIGGEASDSLLTFSHTLYGCRRTEI